MHMVDALLSPAVGATLWAASAAVVTRASRRLADGMEERLAPLMGMTGAFVFAAQMVNFAIPGTGSSGHLGGGLLLTLLLGPQAAVVVMTSVLLVQALLFADGGLLALGANVWNLGVLPAFVAVPLVARPLLRRGHEATGIVLGAVFAHQLGAVGVVAQTASSGITALPLLPFLTAMLPIHLAIGLIEGFATLAVWRVLGDRRPETRSSRAPVCAGSGGGLLAALLFASVLTGGVLSWLASEKPDGLEWSVARAASAEPAAEGRLYAFLAKAQKKLAAFPDYAPRGAAPSRPSTSAAGLVGTAATLGLIAGAALLLRRFGPRR
ncbi:MAG: energy-coupling factor ABC transporter permease [Deltaproteobacteria bacterium]|nr:energy-coupling factor ABC transporter permease [Deltaproteobacteria bacterium]